MSLCSHVAAILAVSTACLVSSARALTPDSYRASGGSPGRGTAPLALVLARPIVARHEALATRRGAAREVLPAWRRQVLTTQRWKCQAGQLG